MSIVVRDQQLGQGSVHMPHANEHAGSGSSGSG